MNKDYNKEKHHQLLKYSEYLRKQGKFIEKESRESYLKLLSYSAMVSSQLNWEIQGEYLEVLKSFCKTELPVLNFVKSWRRNLN